VKNPLDKAATKMKHLSTRLPIASATFLFSLLITNALTVTKRAPACHEQPTLQATPFVSPTVAPPQPTPTPDKTPRISQQEIVNFPGIGRVRISAVETFAESLHLEFRDADTGKLLDSEYFFGEEAEEDNVESPYLRFRVLHVKGLPDPLVVGMSARPAADHDDWKSIAVGAVNGSFRELTSEQLEGTDQGGFYYGNLGHGRGLGTVSWEFVYGNEGHPDPHQYELKVYKWNPKTTSFEWYQVLRTRGKFSDGEKAVRSLGFNVRDMGLGYPDLWSE
jgi:hypothetical protein